jgi:hypothetical protein
MSLLGNPRHGARKRVPPATRRRALELLASCRDGCYRGDPARAWFDGRTDG